MRLDDNIKKWQEALGVTKWEDFTGEALAQIDCFRFEGRILPDSGDLLAAFREVAPEDVRVVVLGQDPYHSTDQHGVAKARGVAFGYNPVWAGTPNSSMLNICTELGVSPDRFDLSLEPWTKQGVLLLNTQLPVEEDRPLSHKGVWDKFVGLVLTHLANRDNIVWLSWGAEARKVVKQYCKEEHSHVTTSHPCRYSAGRGSAKAPAFLGSDCFGKVNELLARLEVDMVEWV